MGEGGLEQGGEEGRMLVKGGSKGTDVFKKVLSLSWSSHDHEARVLSKFLLAAGLTAG